MAKKLWSIFTDNMDKCIVTGMETGIERHHCFPGFNRSKCEQYGFIVPLHHSVHPNGASCSDKNWKELDHWLRRKCQEYYVEVAMIGSRQDWLNTFGKFYDDRCNEKVWLNGHFEWEVNDETTGRKPVD